MISKIRQCSLTFFIVVSSIYHTSISASPDSAEIYSLLELSLSELGQQLMSSSALTEVGTDEAPATVTVITQTMIEQSAARSLEEVLERFVPNLQRLTDTFGGPSFGVRGISGKDKFLVLVNGRNMNHKTFYGLDSELMLSMLGDIHHVEVVRGPGSAVYGPGAISGVIKISKPLIIQVLKEYS